MLATRILHRVSDRSVGEPRVFGETPRKFALQQTPYPLDKRGVDVNQPVTVGIVGRLTRACCDSSLLPIARVEPQRSSYVPPVTLFAWALRAVR